MPVKEVHFLKVLSPEEWTVCTVTLGNLLSVMFRTWSSKMAILRTSHWKQNHDVMTLVVRIYFRDVMLTVWKWMSDAYSCAGYHRWWCSCDWCMCLLNWALRKMLCFPDFFKYPPCISPASWIYRIDWFSTCDEYCARSCKLDHCWASLL
jgi:hypothetical protein